MRRFLAPAALLTALTVVPSYGASAPSYGHETPVSHVSCTGDPSTFHLLKYASGGGTAKALFVVPKGQPRGIVVFDHGYSHTMYSWVRHMERTARTLHVIAVTPDYRGQLDTFPKTGLPSSRGWRVAEGAIDSNTVARLFDRACLHGQGHNVLYSVSMGGNTAGLALAAHPTRLNGAPMFDQWVDVEGDANVLETYEGARPLAAVNTFAAEAKADIEAEMGGTPEQVPQAYADHVVTTHAAQIASSGIKGVVMLHGVMDGLVTHDISRQLEALLLAQGMPVDFTAFVTHTAHSESGTTIDGYLPTGQPSPFAGHASEVSETQDVGVAGFAALADIYAGDAVQCVERVRDGMTDTSLNDSYPCP